MEQEALQRVLKEAYFKQKLKNSSYSLRAFSRKLKMQPSAVSEIMKGKRRVSGKLASRIVQHLSLHPKDAKRVLSLFSGTPKDDASVEQEELSHEIFSLISEWQHFAILSLVETHDFRNDLEWIAERLNLRKSEAKDAVERLLRLGLLREEKAVLKPTGKSFRTSDGVHSTAVQHSHLASFEFAKQVVENVDVEVRDFTSMTFATRVDLLPEAKKLVREFYAKMNSLLEGTSQANEVYQMNIQLLPLTQVRSQEEAVQPPMLAKEDL